MLRLFPWINRIAAPDALRLTGVPALVMDRDETPLSPGKARMKANSTEGTLRRGVPVYVSDGFIGYVGELMIDSADASAKTTCVPMRDVLPWIATQGSFPEIPQ